MKTQTNTKDLRFAHMIIELEDMWEIDCMTFLFHEIEKQVDWNKADKKEEPNNFKLFYINLFKECQRIQEEK